MSQLLQLEECEKEWYVAHVRSRHEKLVAQELSEQDIVHYLPLRKTLKKWSDRRMLIKEPLFPGYIFINTTYDDRTSILATRGVIQLVGSNKKPWLIPAKEIKAIYKTLVGKLKYDPCPYLKIGNEVCVTRGPLKGCYGILIEKNKKHRLVLSIHLIGRSISVEIDATDIEQL